MESGSAEACVSYLKSNPGFDRVMKLLWEKWRSYGRAAGEIILENPEGHEIEALEGFFGEAVYKKGKIRFQAKSFEKALEKTRFQGASLKELLEGYFAKPLITKKEEEDALQQKKEAFFAGTEKQLAGLGGHALLWLRELGLQKLWQLLQMAGSEEQCLKLTMQVGQAIHLLEKLKSSRGIRLAVLAMECAGDPHGFDRGSTPGNLLLGALPILKRKDQPEETASVRVELSPRLSAEDALERYISCGIRPDDLSSFTILYRILLEDESGCAKAYQAMSECREPMLVSLLNLRNICRAVPLNRRVYVLENQMVFSQLCEDCPEASLICTSGQIRTASLMLLDLICKEPVEIYYSGDLDPEGIAIADRLIRRSHGKIKPWHMTARDYEASVSSVVLSPERLRELANIRSESLREAAGAVAAGGKAAYQEKLLGTMEEEIK